jgi:hypothetical protein
VIICSSHEAKLSMLGFAVLTVVSMFDVGLNVLEEEKERR